MDAKTRMWEWINREFESWQKKYPEKEIPSNLSKKLRREWVDEVMLAQEGEDVVISGGGRILLWCAMNMYHPPRVNTSWIKFIEKEGKRGRREWILEAMKFQHREKKLGISLIKNKTLKKYPDALILEYKEGI